MLTEKNLHHLAEPLFNPGRSVLGFTSPEANTHGFVRLRVSGFGIQDPKGKQLPTEISCGDYL
jgi:hypothetical protein